MAIRFRFGAPRGNWIPLGVMSTSIAFDEVFAASPSDPVHGIASAALAAAGGEPGSCELFAGPEAYTVSFVPGHDGLRFEITAWPDHRRDPGRGAVVFQARGTPTAVLLPVWRGLRELGARWSTEVEEWDAPFPTETVAQLGGALAAARI